MNPSAILKTAGSGHGLPGAPRRAGQPSGRGDHWTAVGIGLWVFMGVATALFSLFIMAYAMRMDSGDWFPIAMPWQLWVSTTLLAAGSVTLHLARTAARETRLPNARVLLSIGGLCAFAFLGVQLWGWMALLSSRVMPAGNPSGSFFYLLTAMHGLHVMGGLVGWTIAMRRAWRHDAAVDRTRIAQSIALCARYWHFLLAVWVVLFAALGWLTPEVVRAICGTG